MLDIDDDPFEANERVSAARIARDQVILDRQKQRAACELFDASKVGNVHAEAVLDKLMNHKKWASVFTEAQEIVENGGILGLLGNRGNGKTQMSVELIKLHSKTLRPCLYMRAAELCLALRETFDNPNLSEMAIIHKFSRPYLLVLDELQDKPNTEFEMRSMNMLIDIRYSAKKPTILIANATAQKFTQIIGPSVADRI